jgi:L-fucose isomerase-like protein
MYSTDTILKISWVAHKGAGADTGIRAEEFMRQLMPPDTFVMTNRQPDIILFMSGGSERKAISLADSGHPVLLLSIRGNNAYAAATEVMAWMINNNRFAVLADAIDAAGSGLLEKWRRAVRAWKSLEGNKAGLIGSVSDWLVASEVPADTLKHVLGVTLTVLPWSALPDYTDQESDDALMSRFDGHKVPGLLDAAKVLSLLRQVVIREKLNAIAVECFSLVQQRKVTACLALAQMNCEGVIAACEGDLASMAGMMLLQAATGSAPWMANTTRLTSKTLILSHCTVAYSLVSNIKLLTHYETDCSLAVDGTIVASEVTLFRLSDSLDRAFIAEGEVAGHPHMVDACRTQVEIALPSQSITSLRTYPLGNHLLMVPGTHGDLMRLICSYKGISVVE